MAVYEANIADFGAKGNGASDDTGAFVQAFRTGAGRVVVPRGNYRITSTLTVPQSVILQGAGSLSRIVKGFNGDMIRMSSGSQIMQLTLDGEGTAYTGRGIVIDSGSSQKITDITIMDTSGYCIEYTAAGAGILSTIDKCNLGATDRMRVPAIKYPGSETNGDRRVTSVDCGGGLLADFAGCSTTLVTDCNTIGVLFRPASKKVSLVGNRIAGGTAKINVELYGLNHCVVGNIIATPIYLRKGTSYSVIMANVSSGVIDESDTGTNTVDGGSPPSNGDGISIAKDYGATTSDSSILNIGAGGPSPDAASIAFGDGTGWKLNVGRRSNDDFVPLFSFYDKGCLYISPMNANQAVNGSLYVDAADQKLKYKDAGGIVRNLY
ncbi:MAG: hypothetical protein K0R28_113 [Paenibacillus sp.]|jgi:hypothetical protein|nr:hypothetical protein [Paenibacillus sp.]